MHRTDGDQISCMTVSFLVLEQLYEVAKATWVSDPPSRQACLRLARFPLVTNQRMQRCVLLSE